MLTGGDCFPASRSAPGTMPSFPIAIGRALIADPAFVEKAARGETVTRCIECNACIKMATVKDLPLGCPVNQEFREYREYRDKESEPWLAQAVRESGGATSA